MNKREAIRLIMDGKKIRKNAWDKGQYIYISDFDIIKDENDERYNINNSTGVNWEIYEEPKKKVTMYKWAYFNRIDKIWIEVAPFFETEKEFMSYIEENLVVKRLDYTATEFEAIEQ